MLKFQSISQLYDILPEHERIIVDVLRPLISENLPEYCKEKLSFNVPYFYENKGICIIWPSTVTGGGIKSGVFFGFWYGNKLLDEDAYLLQGKNKQIFYRIYQTVDEIKPEAIIKLLKEAVSLDVMYASSKKRKAD
jgi:hypothetical protein